MFARRFPHERFERLAAIPALSPLLLLAALLSSAPAMPAATNDLPVHLLVPGFRAEELPVRLKNLNNLRFAPDGRLTALGYDGAVWSLRDTNGDGLEDSVEPYWPAGTLSVPVGMIWSSDGLFVSSKGKVSLLKDTNGDGRGDAEEIIASGWPSTDVGSGGVDATAVTLDARGNVYFGLLVADYSNAYRIRKRSELKSAEIEWLKNQGRWREASGADPANDEFSLYDLNSKRGTIQKFDPRTKKLETIATGIRVPYALAFNAAGDLFNTDQEGETWMPNGNPLDELNHIIPGRNYGFPPRHEKWLPDLVSELPVVGFGPQHQSACGFVFNEPQLKTENRKLKTPSPLPVSPGQGLFGPKWWEGDAFVAGESRGKIWRVKLVKTAQGYVGKAFIIARLDLLTTDLTISPRGELYVSCHSGPPDWGTGPQGDGRIFKITYTDPQAPQPVAAWPASTTEVRVAFDRALDPGVTNAIVSAANRSAGEVRDPPGDARRSDGGIEFGEYVSAGDRFEKLKPPYAVVPQQDATPRGRLVVQAARLDNEDRTLVLTTDPHPLAVNYAVAIPGIKSPGSKTPAQTVDVEYDHRRSSRPVTGADEPMTLERWRQLIAWAPTNRASSGTDSRPPARPAGDWEHGHELFASAQLQCAKCHRVRGDGGVVGPDLSNLIHRDPTSVLRDIRDPGATLHPDYVTYLAALKNGETATGFVRSQGADSLRLFDAEGKETVIPRSELSELRPTGLSLMPTGLLDALKPGDITDLLTFLLWEPPTRTRAETEWVLGAAGAPSSNPARTTPATVAPTNQTSPLQIVLVASKQDHGPGQHDYPRWQDKWLRLLSGLNTEHLKLETAWEWPSPEQFATANVLVFYFWNHDWSQARYAQIDAFQRRGGGMALIHAAVIADKDPEKLAERIGLSAQPGRTGYRHMPFDLRFVAKDHPLTQGLPEWLSFLDEPYWPLIGDPKNVTVLASAEVDGAARPLVWTFERGFADGAPKGRVFASVLGHYFWTLDDPLWRLFVLRGIAWAGRREVDSLVGAAALEATMK